MDTTECNKQLTYLDNLIDKLDRYKDNEDLCTLLMAISYPRLSYIASHIGEHGNDLLKQISHAIVMRTCIASM